MVGQGFAERFRNQWWSDGRSYSAIYCVGSYLGAPLFDEGDYRKIFFCRSYHAITRRSQDLLHIAKPALIEDLSKAGNCEQFFRGI
jgi:hypothetical protein